MQKALKAYRTGAMKSLNKAALGYGYIPSGVQARHKGVPPRRLSHIDDQLLSPEQEDDLADWIVDPDRQHNAPTSVCVREMAEAILSYERINRTIGKKWHLGSIERIRKVDLLIGKPQKSKRIEQAIEKVVWAWSDSFHYEMTYIISINVVSYFSEPQSPRRV